VCLASFNLDNGTDQGILQALIEETEAGLVIIDALADITAGDENSKQDTQPVFNALRKIADKTGAAIVVIHHSNKLGGYRGSSAIKGAVDLMIKVEKEENNNIIHFSTEKNRDGGQQKWSAKAAWENDTFTLVLADGIQGVKLSAAESYVLQLLENKGGPASLSLIMGSADVCTESTAKKAVYSLVKKGKIYRMNSSESGQGIEAIYDLSYRLQSRLA
jgi:hypothetical protein